MEKRDDIFYYLRDHEIPPPPAVEDRLRRALASENTHDLQHLMDHPVRPPEELRQLIMKEVLTSPKASKIKLVYYIAAACVLALLAGVVIYNIPRGKSASSNNLVSQPRRQQDPHPGKYDPDSTGSTTVQPPGPTDSPLLAENRPISPVLTLDGEKYPLTDNNLLATFTSYEYPAIKPLLQQKKFDGGWRIRLDQYTNITLSKPMISMLRALYDTRPDGSASRKARKTKQQLLKWSDQDKKQFALDYAANPLDAIDLAEFLFPPFLSFGHHTPDRIPPADTPSPAGPDTPAVARIKDNPPLTISYLLTVNARRSVSGIGETYNGGVLTLFDSGSHARLRLASLMRIQSLLFDRTAKSLTILTESVRPQSKKILNESQWSLVNRKYGHAATIFSDDTATILGYLCKKAMIRLHDGRRITVWYTSSLHAQSQTLLQPAFSAIPGLVLQYEYTHRHKTLKYTASSLSRAPIDPAVFTTTHDAEAQH